MALQEDTLRKMRSKSFFIEVFIFIKEVATCSSIAWEVLWTEEPGGYSPLGPKRVRHDLATKTNNINFIAYKCLVRKISLGIGI